MSPRQRPAWVRTSGARHRAVGHSRLYLATRTTARALVALLLGALLPAYLLAASWLVEATR